MSNERWIDGNALLDELKEVDTTFELACKPGFKDLVNAFFDKVRNAPTVTLQPAGDAISREAVVKALEHMYAHVIPNDITPADVTSLIRDLPSLPVAAPDVDVVTAEEIVEGITWGPEGPLQRKVHRWFEEGVDLEFFHGTRVGMSHHEVADLLTGAMRRGESVTWPEGHPRNPTKPKPPTLLEELLKAYIELHSAMALATGGIPLTTPLIRKVEAAIERDEGKEGTK